MSFNIPKLRIKFMQRFPQLIEIKNWWKMFLNVKYQKGEYKTDKFVLQKKLGDTYQKISRIIF